MKVGYFIAYFPKITIFWSKFGQKSVYGWVFVCHELSHLCDFRVILTAIRTSHDNLWNPTKLLSQNDLNCIDGSILYWVFWAFKVKKQPEIKSFMQVWNIFWPKWPNISQNLTKNELKLGLNQWVRFPMDSNPYLIFTFCLHYFSSSLSQFLFIWKLKYENIIFRSYYYICNFIKGVIW